MSLHLPVCYGLIPARYASTRFPGKPLVEILGKPMFRHVYERATACRDLAGVWLATDDLRIRNAAEAHGVPVVMTSPDHASGTDRIREAADVLGLPEDCVVVNIQGDEPALDPAMVSELLAPFVHPTVHMATLARPIDAARAASPDQVKVVVDGNGRALYFSRAAIPHPAHGAADPGYLGHVGLYAFRRAALDRFTALPPSRLEGIEKLEQLRWLEAGYPLHVSLTLRASHGVDRPEDLAAVSAILAAATE